MLSMIVGPDAALVATQVEPPEPEPEEAVVAVTASSLNRGELALISARGQGWAPGQDVAGVVVRAAADDSGPPEGERVVGLTEQGAWSEQVAVRANRLAVVPDDVDLTTAAALPMAGLTALRTLRLLGPMLARRILVTGASGGVGRLQVQLAKIAGADVVALSRSDAVPEADLTVADAADAAPVDAALDSVGGPVLKAVIGRLRPGSPLVWFGSSSGEPADLSIYDLIGESISIHTYFSYTADPSLDPEDLAALLGLLGTGRLEAGVAERLPLTEATAATHNLREKRTRGKIVLTAT